MPVGKDKKTTPVLYVFFGMIATGKSTLSQAWAWHKQLRCYNSDWVRKELAGISPTASRRSTIDSGIYSKEFSQKTYSALLARAEICIISVYPGPAGYKGPCQQLELPGIFHPLPVF
jgi:predicted kinase